MGKWVDSHRLHAVDIVNDRQTMEGKTAVAEMVDVLDPEGIGTTMRYAQGTSTLFDDVLVTPKYCPDSTHIIFCKQKFGYEINQYIFDLGL